MRTHDELTRPEIELLIGATGRGKTALRNAAGVAIMWRCGLRNAELCDLRFHDVDIQKGVIIVQRGKGGRRRTCVMDSVCKYHVQLWIDERARFQEFEKCEYFLPTHLGSQTMTSYWRDLLPRLASRVGLKKRVHPHALRHAFACELLREGYNVRTIQLALGHQSLAATQRYLDRFPAIELIEKIGKRT